MIKSPIFEKEGYAMHEDTVVLFSHPDRISIDDPLTEVLRSGARRLLAEAIEAEVSGFIAEHADLVDEAGRRRVVRDGHRPEREIQTGIGAVFVCRPRLDHDKQCLLVIIGADERGTKDIVGLSDGYRESEQSWLELLLDLKRRGLTAAPELATGDGASRGRLFLTVDVRPIRCSSFP